MKRMSYLARGMAAMTQAVVAGVMPGRRPTLVRPPRTERAPAKTVSLNHSSAAAAAGCTGTVAFGASHRSGAVRMHGWYTTRLRQKCIGTVVGEPVFHQGDRGKPIL